MPISFPKPYKPSRGRKRTPRVAPGEELKVFKRVRSKSGMYKGRGPSVTQGKKTGTANAMTRGKGKKLGLKKQASGLIASKGTSRRKGGPRY